MLLSAAIAYLRLILLFLQRNYFLASLRYKYWIFPTTSDVQLASYGDDYKLWYLYSELDRQESNQTAES